MSVESVITPTRRIHFPARSKESKTVILASLPALRGLPTRRAPVRSHRHPQPLEAVRLSAIPVLFVLISPFRRFYSLKRTVVRSSRNSRSIFIERWKTSSSSVASSPVVGHACLVLPDLSGRGYPLYHRHPFRCLRPQNRFLPRRSLLLLKGAAR